MDIEKTLAIVRRARLAQKDADLHSVLKIVEVLVHEVSIARGEIGLLELRVGELEDK